MSKQPPPSNLGAALQQANQRALQRTSKKVFRHKTWPGVFVPMGEVETRWEGRGRDSLYWSRLRVLEGRAKRLAENPAVPQGDRARARRVCALVDDFIRLAGPPEGLYNLSIFGFKKARDHLERLDKAGRELREAAETLGLADPEKPIYVPSTYVFGKHAQKVQRATDRATARCRMQFKAAEAAAKHGQRPPVTPDAKSPEGEPSGFLGDVADEVHGLFFPPAPPANMQRFRDQIQDAIKYQNRHDDAKAELERREQEHREKVKQDPRLRDHQAGPPKKGWQWEGLFIVDEGVTPLVDGGVTPFQEGAWLPPGFPTEFALPPEPVPSGNPPENIPWEVVLTGEYVRLAIVHDNVDADPTNPGGRRPLLTNFDLPPSFCRMRQHGPNPRPAPALVDHGFGRESIKRALMDVKADLESHQRQPGGGAAEVGGKAATQATPETDPALIYQAGAATFYNIPPSVLCKAARKKPGEPGYLWSGRGGKGKGKRKRVWYRKKDMEKIACTRKALGRASQPSGKPKGKHPAHVALRVSGKESLEENQRRFLANYGQEDAESKE